MPCKQEVPGSIPWCGLKIFVSAFEAQSVEQPAGMRQAACSIHAHSALKTRVNALLSTLKTRVNALLSALKTCGNALMRAPFFRCSNRYAPVAQRQEAAPSEGAQCRFESRLAHQICYSIGAFTRATHSALRAPLDGAIGSQCGRRRLANQYGRQSAIQASRLGGVAPEPRFRSICGRPCM